MHRRMLLLVSAVLLAGCATTHVTDFTDRSLAYGWLNIEGVGANRLDGVSIYQFRPQTSEPYYHAAVREFKGGYLYWTVAVPNGAYKTISASGQRCLGLLCSSTRYEYSFAKQGDDLGAVTIRAPGVYYLGSLDLKDVKTGLFDAARFQALPSPIAPGRREMLQEILDATQGNPVMAERIRRELAELQ